MASYIRRLALLAILLGATADLPAHAQSRGGAAGGESPSVLARPSGTAVRVLVWNVAGRPFLEAPEAFRRVIRAVDPDVLLLDEVASTSSGTEVAFVLRELRGPDDTIWHAAFGASGGHQRGVILSRKPVRPSPPFTLVAYPSAATNRLLELVPDRDERSRLEASLSGGVGANGGVIELDDHLLLAVAVDFQCCGDGPASWQELRRRAEAELVQQTMRKALEDSSVDAIVLGGDLNLVAGPAPLETLLEPLPEPHGSLAAAEAHHVGGRATWTWDGRGTRFPSAALTRLLYTPRSLVPLRGFVFDTEDLPPRVLRRLGLQGTTSKELSDQRPVVVDFRWSRPRR